MADHYPRRPQHGHKEAYQFGRAGQQQDDGRAAYNDAPGNFNFNMSISKQPPRFPEPPPGFNPPSQPARDRRDRARPWRDRGRGGGRDGHGGHGGRGGRGRYGPPPTSSRPLLRGERAPTPEQMYGTHNGKARFKKYEDMSDSEEQDMDLETGSEDGEQVQPPIKKARLEHEPSATAVPKWSNPDPYYVLPPTDETAGTKKDVVKMIRKAKAAAAAPQAQASHGDDFISFNFNDAGEIEISSDSDDSSVIEVGHFPSARGDRFSHLDNLHADRYVPTDPVVNGYPDAKSRPPPKTEGIDTWPPPTRSADGASDSGRLRSNEGSAKRGRKRRAAELEDDSVEFAGRKRSDRGNAQPTVKMTPCHPHWRASRNTDPTPWMDSVKPCDDFEAMFDKELEGFYAWIRPVRAENSVRTDLVKSVQKFLDKSYAGATVKYFGSFATGLYLPEGDMDLVIVSREFLEGDYPKLGLKPGQLYKMSGQMERAGLIKPGSSNVIAHARVPLIKYADRQSGVKVDISFENLSGLNTTETCNAWRKEFPALPIMVTLVKQFLLMRDLNDVSTGGLGGFSITCLIVSLLQRNPDLAAKNSPGEIFMEFLDHYGNHFDYHKLAIELNPPRLARKPSHQANQAKLSIKDPNRADNDISRGTYRIEIIFRAFSAAFDILKEQLSLLRPDDVHRERSLLEPIFGGNYESYVLQRELMLSIYTPPAPPANRGLYVEPEERKEIVKTCIKTHSNIIVMPVLSITYDMDRLAPSLPSPPQDGALEEDDGSIAMDISDEEDSAARSSLTTPLPPSPASSVEEISFRTLRKPKIKKEPLSPPASSPAVPAPPPNHPPPPTSSSVVPPPLPDYSPPSASASTNAVSQAPLNPVQHPVQWTLEASRMANTIVWIYPVGFPDTRTRQQVSACHVTWDMPESTTLIDISDPGLQNMVRLIQIEYNHLNAKQCLHALKGSKYDFYLTKNRLKFQDQQPSLNG